ncbi:UBA/THIF-type NAD/FAD binding protein [Desulfovibrio sp. X2]|uniref:ThiF family adenylyltransferase n=1 Tax=Desulfovibrio sp. X2 TaxID=941449 RepID=UPI000358F2FE|nr:ThiF family adenylyltransferase [Desulfovibrio sp. X2]EPR37254.1 UBA/THIF-type NAD/FAD binding protein [Desulfovibrio sp. X2]
MTIHDYAKKLHEIGIDDPTRFQDEAFARNLGLYSIEEQDRISEARVVIPGLGGVGGLHLISLVRCGFRRFRLADPDSFELVNINRQFGASVATRGRPKLEVMSETAASINPFVEIEPFPEGVTEANLDAFLADADVVVDSLDFFEFDIRRRLFMRARELGVPVITAGPLGFSTALLVFTPDSMSFDEYFDVQDGLPMEQCYLRFAMGLSPRGVHFRYVDSTKVDLKGRAGPSSYIACQLCAAAASMEAARIVLGRPGLRPTPGYLQYDAYRGQLCKGRLRGGNRNPLQRLKLALAGKLLLARRKRIGHEAPDTPKGPFTAADLSPAGVRYLAAAGAAAPSGDNVQPWRFTPVPGGMRVRMAAEADTSFFNVRQIATLIACGAAAENMAVAAPDLGLAASVEVLPEPEADGGVAVVRFSDGGREDFLAPAVWSRCTNRMDFSARPLSPGIRARLAREVESVPGCRLHFVEGKDALTRLADVVFKADRIRTEHRGLHEHFVKMVRFSREEAEQTRDGLPLKNLYGGAAGEMFLRLTRPWPVMRAANALGMGKVVAAHARKGILHSGACCLLTAPGLAARDFAAGGRALERCWLRLTRVGLAMQPMTAVTLFRLRWDLEGPEAFSAPHQALLSELWSEYDALFPAADFGREGQVMLFRVGYGKPVRFGTFRKDPDAFLG